jgi:hypothetical protein
MEEKIFVPERAHLRKEVLYSVVGVVVLGPLILWWKGTYWPMSLGTLPFVLLFLLGQDFYGARVRGRDFVYITAEGIRVTNKKKVWLMPWRDVYRVHRFKEQLVFETVAPHRRETLSLEGHDKNLAALRAAVAERAHTMNLAWVETLTDLFG